MSKYYVDIPKLKEATEDIKKITRDNIEKKISDLLTTFEEIEWASITKESYEDNFRLKINQLKDINKKLEFYCYFLNAAFEGYDDVNELINKKYQSILEELNIKER